MLQRLYSWYGKNVVHGFLILIMVLIAVGAVFALHKDEPELHIENGTGVETERVSSLSSGRTLELIGEVESVSEDTITSEASGRVVRVNVGLGDSVKAGTVIAELENASERAAVIQAEGTYEAALAHAAQSNVGVREAENMLRSAEQNAVSAYTNAYTNVSDVIRSLIDELFSDPDGRVPGLRIDGFGNTEYLNGERRAFETVLTDWQRETTLLDTASDLEAALGTARTRTDSVLRMVDTFLSILPRQDPSQVFTETVRDSYISRFSSARGTLISTRTSLDSAVTGLKNAREALERARLSGTGGAVSAADAQVKQALGNLRAAQANLEKTILRSSIAGTVNSLRVKQGDFVGVQDIVARVANNRALEITTYVSEAERDTLAIGKPVRINKQYEGTVTNIAPAVDPDTKKIEVKIAAETDALENGDSVRIAVENDEGTANSAGPITIPITALKVETDREVVFTVSPVNTLIAHEVTVGPLLGASVIIESGITRDMEIVTDARGLNEGDTVIVIE